MRQNDKQLPAEIRNWVSRSSHVRTPFSVWEEGSGEVSKTAYLVSRNPEIRETSTV